MPKHRVSSAHTTLSAHGAPLVWLTGGALATALLMIIGLLMLVLYEGLQTFWPAPLVQLEVKSDGAGPATTLLGEISRSETFKPEPTFLDDLKQHAPDLFAKAQAEMASHDGLLRRQLIWTGRTAAVDFAGSRAMWVNDFAIQSQSHPEWAIVVERFDGGRSYGTPAELTGDGKSVANGPEEVWSKYNELHGEVLSRWRLSVSLDRNDRGAIDRRERSARLALVGAQLNLKDLQRDHPGEGAAIQSATTAVETKQKTYDSVEVQAVAEKAKITDQIKALEAENARYALHLTTAAGSPLELPLADIMRAYPANRLSLAGKLGVYASRWWEFLTADPRESNTEGGVFPAIWGTVAMTLIMSVLVVPFGVLAALYLREYAKAGAIVSAIRISINNLAGVPSIVFGVFGLGLFCYVIGASIDQLFFRAALSEGTPTFGTGGIMWASFTLALLTLPVVIVATEEALAAVPNSMREGSYACGGSKWQTIRRIVLPRAMPGIMTGMILAMARGAGEVAPLLLVGVKDLSPSLPVDGVFPYVHPERSFMHLAYQIYIVGFKSPNAETAKPMVFTTTLLLIVMVAMLSITAVYLRSKLRKRFVLTQF
ncbi:MAG TPA: phosphate ABC transporter permease PstA [Pirellulales bacterium]|nr:phosphate ABC transporter permease PstA [Pirellulales bacterium]